MIFILKLIEDKSANIVCLEESNLKANKKLKTKDFTYFNKNRQDCEIASGRVCTLGKNDLISQELHLIAQIETLKLKSN